MSQNVTSSDGRSETAHGIFNNTIAPSDIKCDDGVFEVRPGKEITWYKTSDFKEKYKQSFVIHEDIHVYGRYEKAVQKNEEYISYELKDYIKDKDGHEISYVTKDNVEELAKLYGISSTTTTTDFQLTDTTMDPVSKKDAVREVTTYTYDGEKVLVKIIEPTLSFSSLSLKLTDSDKGYDFDRSNEGISFNPADSSNTLTAYVQSAPVTLQAFCKRATGQVTIDENRDEGENNVNNDTYLEARVGQTITLKDPVRAGYKFIGWSFSGMTEGVANPTITANTAESTGSFGMPYSEKVKVTANWTPQSVNQKVVYHYQNTDLTYGKGVEAVINPQPTQDGSIVLKDYLDKTEKTTHYKLASVIRTYKGQTYVFTEAEVNNAETPATVTEKTGMQLDYYYQIKDQVEIQMSAELQDWPADKALPVALTGDGNYVYGRDVTLSAIPAAGYVVTGWYYGTSSAEGSEIQKVSRDSALTANDTINSVNLFINQNVLEKATDGKLPITVKLEALPVAVPTFGFTNLPELTYGYKVSNKNAVTVKVNFPDGYDSANYVKSYKWSLTSGQKETVSGDTSTLLIPEGWEAGDYQLQCEVTIARRDNGLEKTYTVKPDAIRVEQKAMTVSTGSYTGIYDGAAHTFTLAVTEPAGYTVYVAKHALTADTLSGDDVKSYTTAEDLKAGLQKDFSLKNVGSETYYYYIESGNTNYLDFGTDSDGESLSQTVTVTPKQVTIKAGNATFSKEYDGLPEVRGSVKDKDSDWYRLATTPNIYTIEGMVKGEEGLYVIAGKGEFNGAHVKGTSGLTLSELTVVDKSNGDINKNYSFDPSYSINMSGEIKPREVGLSWDKLTQAYSGNVLKPEVTIAKDALADSTDVSLNTLKADLANLSVLVPGQAKTVGTYDLKAELKAAGSTQLSDFRIKDSDIGRTFEITKRKITVTPESAEYTYDRKVKNLPKLLVSLTGETGTDDELLETHRVEAKTDKTAKDVMRKADGSVDSYDVKAVNARVYDSDGTDVTENNFEITYGTGHLTIQPQDVTVSGIRAKDKTYNGDATAELDSEQSAVKFDGIVAGDELKLDWSKVSGTFVDETGNEDPSVGTGKTVKITYGDSALTGKARDNYTLKTDGSQARTTANITAKKVSVKVNVSADDATVVYGEKASFKPEFTGLKEDDISETTIEQLTQALQNSYMVRKQDGKDAIAYSEKTAAGDYVILPDVDVLNDKAKLSELKLTNYTFVADAKPGELHITKRPVAITFGTFSKVYDGNADAKTTATTVTKIDGNKEYQITADNGETAEGLLSGDDLSIESYTANFDEKNAIDAAKDYVTVKDIKFGGDAAENYKPETAEVRANGQITKAKLTVQVLNKTITYGDEAPDYEEEITGFMPGDSEESLDKTAHKFICAYSKNDSENRNAKGSEKNPETGYVITAEGYSSGNYEFEYKPGYLIVNKAVLTIAIKAADSAQDKVKSVDGKDAVVVTYGKDTLPEFTYEVTGWKYDESKTDQDAITGTVTNDASKIETKEVNNVGGTKGTIGTVVTAVAGSYPVSPVVTAFVNTNYTYKLQPMDLVVERLGLTVKNIKVDDRVYDGTNKVYDSQIHKESADYQTLLSIDEDKKGIDSVTASYEQDVNVHKETLQLHVTLNEYLRERYLIEENEPIEVESSIKPRPLTVTADNKEVFYGDQKPDYTVTYEKAEEGSNTGLVGTENPDENNVSLTSEYKVSPYTLKGEYPITFEEKKLKDSDGFIAVNYAPTFVNGTLTVKQAELAAPDVVWSTKKPGVVTWSESQAVGNVAVDSYVITLYKNGTPVADSTKEIKADQKDTSILPSDYPYSFDYSDKIHESGEGQYTVKVKAIGSKTNNDDYNNVKPESAEKESNTCYAANVSFVADGDSKALKLPDGRDAVASTKINGKDSVIMIAGESGYELEAVLSETTGYEIGSVKADSPLAIAEKDANDTVKTDGKYTTKVSLSEDSTAYGNLNVVLHVNPLMANVKVSVKKTSDKSDTATFGYEEHALSYTATVEPQDNYKDYTYQYQWFVGRKNADGTYETIVTGTPSDSTTEINSTFADFPVGQNASDEKNHYLVRCQVTATRKDNGKYATYGEVFNAEDTTNAEAHIERNTFTASVRLDNWTYGEARKTPVATVSGKVNEADTVGEPTFEYSTDKKTWTTTVPTNAGDYFVNASYEASQDYDALTTDLVPFTIAKAKLKTPDKPSMSAVYGMITWNAVPVVKENAGNEGTASEVVPSYEVKLYTKDSAGNVTLKKEYKATPDTTLNIYDDIKETNTYLYSVTAVVPDDEKKNCIDSAESDKTELIVGESAYLSGEKLNPASEWYTGDVLLKALDGYQIARTTAGPFSDSLTISQEGKDVLPRYALKDGEGSIYEKELAYKSEEAYRNKDAKALTKDVWIDLTPAKGEFSVKTNAIAQFLSTITSWSFFKKTDTVTITTEDKAAAENAENSGVAEAETAYYLYKSEVVDGHYTGLTADKVSGLAEEKWTKGTSVKVAPTQYVIVYARIKDNAGHKTFIGTDGLVFYQDSLAKDGEISYTKTTKDSKSVEVDLRGNTIAAVYEGSGADRKQLNEQEASVSGSIITLTGDYLDTLAAGDHIFSVSYNAGGSIGADPDLTKTYDERPTDTTFTVHVKKRKR